MTSDNLNSGMTRRQARTVEYSIIGLCIVAMVMIFQPFSLTLFSVGAGLVVLAGLAFNLVPFCRPVFNKDLKTVKPGGVWPTSRPTG